MSNESKEAGIDAIASVADAIISYFSPVTGVGALNDFRKYILARKEDRKIKKLQMFFEEASKINEKEKANFLKQIESDPTEFWDQLLTVLDRLIEKEKATIIGNLFKALSRERINLNEFKRLFLAVDNIYLDTLKFLDLHFRKSLVHLPVDMRIRFNDKDKRFFMTGNEEAAECQPLLAYNLVEQKVKIGYNKIKPKIMGGEPEPEQEVSYELSSLGQKLILYGILDRENYEIKY